MSLQQELGFYRNTLVLSGDLAIGLKLGEPYVSHSVMGCSATPMLSAPTFRHALTMTENFGRLTFSFFSFKYGVCGRQDMVFHE